jgi:hypothetical protein
LKPNRKCDIIQNNKGTAIQFSDFTYIFYHFSLNIAIYIKFFTEQRERERENGRKHFSLEGKVSMLLEETTAYDKCYSFLEGNVTNNGTRGSKCV